MIATLLALALLQQSVQTPAALTVRAGEQVSRISVLSTRLGAMVLTDDLLVPLGGVLMRDAPDRYRLLVGGAELELSLGVPSVRIRGVTEPLEAAPTISQGRLYLPLALVTDVLPRRATGFLYDAAAFELRRFTPVVASRRLPGDSAPRDPPARSADVDRDGRTSRDTAKRRTRERAIVVVDAGHGGRDRGMRGPLGSSRKVHEADIVLALAHRLRDELTRRGVDVVMTRSTDTLVALRDRGRIANRSGAELFISLHVNAANPRWRNPGAARGFETYFLSDAKTEDERRVAELENEAVKYEVESSATPDDPLSFVLNDMKQNEYLRESSELARTVQEALRAVHPGTDRGVKQAGFVVLVGAFMPAVLVEVGFGTNSAESVYLSGARGQRTLAQAIAEATMAYLAGYAERRTARTTP